MEDIKETVEEGYTLTEEDKTKILDSMKEEVEKSETLNVLADLPSNNGVEEHTSEDGEYVNATISVDPNTGEKIITNTSSIEEDDEEKSELDDVEAIPFEFDETITAEDVKKSVESKTNSVAGKYDISDETTMELLDLINKYKSRSKITYNDLPPEIKEIVDNYLKEQGIYSHDVQAKTIRNTISEMMIEEFVNDISMNKMSDQFQSGIENIMKEAGEELSPLFKDYNDSRDEYLKKIIADSDDEEKKATAGRILDAIHESYTLEKFAEAVKSIKIKKFDIEKPERSFDRILAKYRFSKYNIYDFKTMAVVLDRHLKQNKLIDENDDETAIKFMVAFAKYCQNMTPEVVEEHTFMYYFTYNIATLDIYKGDQYNQYRDEYLAKSIMNVINNLK